MLWIILACIPGIIASIALGLWIRRETSKYYIRPMKPDAWGTRFAIVAPNDEVVGFDWLTVAKQRCRALNKEQKRQGAALVHKSLDYY